MLHAMSCLFTMTLVVGLYSLCLPQDILVKRELANDQHAHQALAMGCVSLEEGTKLLQDMEVRA